MGEGGAAARGRPGGEPAVGVSHHPQRVGLLRAVALNLSVSPGWTQVCKELGEVLAPHKPVRHASFPILGAPSQRPHCGSCIQTPPSARLGAAMAPAAGGP